MRLNHHSSPWKNNTCCDLEIWREFTLADALRTSTFTFSIANSWRVSYTGDSTLVEHFRRRNGLLSLLLLGQHGRECVSESNHFLYLCSYHRFTTYHHSSQVVSNTDSASARPNNIYHGDFVATQCSSLPCRSRIIVCQFIMSLNWQGCVLVSLRMKSMRNIHPPRFASFENEATHLRQGSWPTCSDCQILHKLHRVCKTGDS